MGKPHNASQRGFSLVELMVALLIGVILTSGVISVFITSRASYSMNTGLGQVQEAGRYALGIMQPALVMAGNTGCKHTSSVNSEINSTDGIYNFSHAVYGFEYTGTGIGANYPATGAVAPIATSAGSWSPSLTALLTAKLIGTTYPAVQYSDVLMVHEMAGSSATLSGDDGSASGTLTYSTTNAPSMSTGMVMIASNCIPEVISFQASGVTGTTVSHAFSGSPGNSAAPSGTTVAWPNFALNGGYVAPAQTYVFFVGKGVGGESSLFEATLDTSGATAGQLGTPKEKVPGVENMQVLYGVDTDATPDQIPNYYATASQVELAGQWDRVVSVRVALLVHSDSNTTDQAPSSATNVHMLGTTTADSFTYKPAVDRRLRRYFVQTFSLRNLLP